MLAAAVAEATTATAAEAQAAEYRITSADAYSQGSGRTGGWLVVQAVCRSVGVPVEEPSQAHKST